MKTTALPKVSFIIPTLNAAGILEKCLKAIRNQNYPKKNIEIIVSDGGSQDKTITVAKKYKAKVIHNAEILHEPGKTLATKYANGNLLFFTDADNILSHRNWLKLMVKPYVDDHRILGFLPQTIPAPDTNLLDRYLGFLCTDPFTWFIYQNATSGRDYGSTYQPCKKTSTYSVYQFPKNNMPLFGLSQGVGINKNFNRGGTGRADDMIAGINLMQQGGLIAYVPNAGVYHYHVSGLGNFIKKYSWRARNNLSQQIKGMGLTNRTKFLTVSQKIRMYAFIPYAFTVILPILDAIRLTFKHKDMVMLLHILMTFVTASVITTEYIRNFLFKTQGLSTYE